MLFEKIYSAPPTGSQQSLLHGLLENFGFKNFRSGDISNFFDKTAVAFVNYGEAFGRFLSTTKERMPVYHFFPEERCVSFNDSSLLNKHPKPLTFQEPTPLLNNEVRQMQSEYFPFFNKRLICTDPGKIGNVLKTEVLKQSEKPDETKVVSSERNKASSASTGKGTEQTFGFTSTLFALIKNVKDTLSSIVKIFANLFQTRKKAAKIHEDTTLLGNMCNSKDKELKIVSECHISTEKQPIRNESTTTDSLVNPFLLSTLLPPLVLFPRLSRRMYQSLSPNYSCA